MGMPDGGRSDEYSQQGKRKCKGQEMGKGWKSRKQANVFKAE